ncbi:MAG: ferrous iron transport protein B [Thermoleophilia bacterium]
MSSQAQAGIYPDPGIQAAAGKTVTIAVAGNPNSGKSTLINAIAGTKLHVGNWAGVTVEKKEAVFDYEGGRIRLVDLPGIYSMSPYSQEEVIARNYLSTEMPDVIVDVVDSTNLERNLYLTVQLLELGLPVVLALNISDEADKKGYSIDSALIAEMMGVTVVKTSATKKRGLDDLLKAVVRVAKDSSKHHPRQLNYGEDIDTAVKHIEARLRNDYPALDDSHSLRWIAIKLMEGDGDVQRRFNISSSDPLTDRAFAHLKKGQGEDIESMLADARYAQAAGVTREVLHKPETDKVELTEKIDRVVLSRLFGIPIFLLAMWLLFKLTFDISTPFVDWVDAVITGPLTRWTEAILAFVGASDWMVSLAVDGVIGGVGSVLVFVPVIFAMMFFITFLEGSGYMARAAFVMDRAMHKIGLHGKSFIPMILGFGCNVPAIYATRTLENRKDKVLTALIIPLMSCGARLPVYVLFTAAFFSAYKSTVLWSLYVLGIAMAILMGLIFKKTIFKGEAPTFVMELPPYRMPSFRSLMIHTWEKGKHFLIKAGTYIFAVSILVWFLINLPWGVEDQKDSYLGQAGQVAAPVLQPLGFGNWQAASSLFSGLIAKEIVVGTMGQIYAPEDETEVEEETPTFLEDTEEIGTSFAVAVKDSTLSVVSSFGITSITAEDDPEQAGLTGEVAGAFTPLSAFAFMAFVLLYMPCVILLIASRQEFGTWKWAGVAFGYQMVLAWVVAAAIYQGGKLLGFGA